MKATDWKTVRRHFEALCNEPADVRREALERLPVSAEIRMHIAQLLTFDDDTGLDELTARVGDLSRQIERAAEPGQAIGPYRLVRSLGSGGMGEVFLAERADGRYEATVAIKFLAVDGARGRRLFDRERRILARLNHPAIARLLDAGEHPHQGAYLVMEYVDGQPVHRAARERCAGGRRVVAWIARAADAVSFAHQNLVLHRDLKPEHLVVSRDGTLKILDFGVATMIRPDAGVADRTAHSSFTPRYAAPEQILHQPTTTRTDIYALGLVLHELLADGDNPFGPDDAGLAERKLLDRPARLPPHPDFTPAQMRDLGAIVARCIRRDPGERYVGASELATDLHAVLHDRPVSVRLPGPAERARRWLGRHRLAGAAVIIATLAVLGGSVLSTWFAHQAQIERDAALQEAVKAREITAFLERIFKTSTPGVEQGPDTPVRALLDRGRERIGLELAEQPEVATYLELAIARSYMFLGLYDEALSLLEPNPGREGAGDRTEHELLAARLDNLQGRYRQALARTERLPFTALTPNQRAQAHLQRAIAEINLGELEAAAESAAAAAASAGDDEPGLDLRLAGRSMQGVVAFNRNDLETARQVFQDTHHLEVMRHGPIHDAVGLALSNLGGVAYRQGDLDAALDYYRRAIDVFQAYFGVDNRAMATALRGQGITLRRLGDAAAAEATLRRAADAFGQWGGRDNPAYLGVLLELAELLVIAPQPEEALALLAQLASVPATAVASERPIRCRLERIATLLGVAGSSERHCSDEPPLPASAMAFDHYIRALGHPDRDPDISRDIAAARALLHTLTPPDPLLAAALDRLSAAAE